MRIAATGFVSGCAGSVAAANALLLRAFLENGMEIDFFSKPSFVDPRPAVGDHNGFRFVPVVNRSSDLFRRRVENIPLLGLAAGRNDTACYNRLLVRRIRAEHQQRGYDLILWLGDYAQGTVPGVATVSFAQGAPGSDARSILRRRAEIRKLAGKRMVFQWEVLARLRLSRFGLPRFHNSDHLIVGSSVSRERLANTYHIPRDRISALPYPIDLDLFCPSPTARRSPITVHRFPASSLRALWLGRVVPRKRLDLFLDGAALALRQNLDLSLTIVGDIGFVRGYERLISGFPFSDRLTWIRTLPRKEVPNLLRSHDLLVQPSEEEDFGSSAAEAQACGLPVIVGLTNGNSGYLCGRDIHLTDDKAETLAVALKDTAQRLVGRADNEVEESRKFAERNFDIGSVSERLRKILEQVTATAGN